MINAQTQSKAHQAQQNNVSEARALGFRADLRKLKGPQQKPEVAVDVCSRSTGGCPGSSLSCACHQEQQAGCTYHDSPARW